MPSEKWPGDANLEIARVWARRTGERWSGSAVLAGKEVREIGPYLVVPGTTVGPPQRLAANAGKSFIGSYVLGLGFTMTPEEAEALIAKDPRNADVLFPYLNGKDLNSHPEQKPSRWVINFFDWPLERAADYPDCLRIFEEKVKPQRDALGNGNPTARDRSRRWWQFARPTLALYEAIGPLARVLRTARVSSHSMFSLGPTGIVASEQAVVFADDRYSLVALLQSNFHEAWARKQGSSMRNDLRYTPTDCFDTFPFPESIDPLKEIGALYHERRREWMLREQLLASRERQLPARSGRRRPLDAHQPATVREPDPDAQVPAGADRGARAGRQLPDEVETSAGPSAFTAPPAVPPRRRPRPPTTRREDIAPRLRGPAP